MPVTKHFKTLWHAIPSVITWRIWKTRNNLRFKGIQPDWEHIAACIFFDLSFYFNLTSIGKNYPISCIIQQFQEIKDG
ncbi:hypothetical protein Dimus_027184, partial [Dionaea muscipula]